MLHYIRRYKHTRQKSFTAPQTKKYLPLVSFECCRLSRSHQAISVRIDALSVSTRLVTTKCERGDPSKASMKFHRNVSKKQDTFSFIRYVFLMKRIFLLYDPINLYTVIDSNIYTDYRQERRRIEELATDILRG